ncbi:MAG: selenium cofactor biosynthesis protein YqeC [Lachnospiraceae bacterium]|nr:selenium cofactor biosynthesis protein YqeC [Lachnospiraceae bacterium]
MSKIIAYVGAGGKTTSIIREARRCVLAGEKVLVTTTTHMRQPQIEREGTDLLTETVFEAKKQFEALNQHEAPNQLEKVLLESGSCRQPEETKPGIAVWYGHPVSEQKFEGPSEEEWTELCKLVDKNLIDKILVEADGSKCLPVKIPASHEPVIPVGTDKIIILMGMRGLGKPLKTVCHRLSLVCGLLKKEPDSILTEQDIALLIIEGYVKPLRKAYPAAEIEVYLSQLESHELTQAAERIEGCCSEISGQ